MAAVNLGAKWVRMGPIGMLKGGKWGFTDARGNVVVPPTYESVHDFSDGLAKIPQTLEDRRVRFIDARGTVVLELYSLAGDFREGLAPVYEAGANGVRTRYIDKKGRTALTVDGSAKEFHEGLAVLRVGKRPGQPDSSDPYRYGYINRTGQIAITPKFTEAREFSQGLAAVHTDNTPSVRGMGGTWGYIQKTGDYAIQPQFNEAHSFRGNVGRVHVGGTLQRGHDIPPFWQGGEWLLIDKEGKVLKRSDNFLEYPKADGR